MVSGEVGSDVTGPVGDDGFAGPDDSGVYLVLVAGVCGHLAVDARRRPVVGEVGIHGVNDLRGCLPVFTAAAGVSQRIDLAALVVDDVGGDDDVADPGVLIMDAASDPDEGPQPGVVVAPEVFQGGHGGALSLALRLCGHDVQGGTGDIVFALVEVQAAWHLVPVKI